LNPSDKLFEMNGTVLLIYILIILPWFLMCGRKIFYRYDCNIQMLCWMLFIPWLFHIISSIIHTYFDIHFLKITLNLNIAWTYAIFHQNVNKSLVSVPFLGIYNLCLFAVIFIYKNYVILKFDKNRFKTVKKNNIYVKCF